MKNFLRKTLSFILALCLTLTLIPTVVIAESGNYYYEEPDQPLDGKTVIIYTGNIRGNIDILPQLTTLRTNFESQGADVLLVDTGNYLQGTIYATYDSGRTIIELMYQTGYDLVAVGSREFDFGTGQIGVVAMHGLIHDDATLEDILEEIPFRVISSNVFELYEEVYENSFPPNAIITTASGRDIGFFGLTDPATPYQVLESNIEGLAFKCPADIAAYQVAALEETDLIIGLSNIGAPLFVPGAIMLDVYSGTGLTVGVVIINEANQIVTHSLINLANVEHDEEMQEVVDAVKEVVHYEFPVWAVSEVTLEGSAAANRSGETNTGNLWANALRWFALEGGIVNFFDEDDIDAGNDRIMVAPENVVAVWNGGNLRDFLNTGHVTMKDLQRVLPFPNRVAVMYLTGAQLLEMLEAATQGLPFTNQTFASAASFPHVAGIEFTIDTTIPFDRGEAYGNHWFRANSIRRVTIDSINGRTFDPAATYAIITSNAIFNGMDSNYISLERCQEYSTITSAFVVDVVWSYIMQELGGVIDYRYATAQGNILINE